jgi:hypothetical protein
MLQANIQLGYEMQFCLMSSFAWQMLPQCLVLEVPLYCASYTNFIQLIIYVSINSVLNKYLTAQWIHETK